MYNNGATLNLQRLLHVVAGALGRCAAHGSSGSVADANAAFLARAVLKDLTEQLNPEQLLAFIELPGAGALAEAPPPPVDLSEFGEAAGQSLVARLARAALEVLAAKPQQLR